MLGILWSLNNHCALESKKNCKRLAVLVDPAERWPITCPAWPPPGVPVDPGRAKGCRRFGVRGRWRTEDSIEQDSIELNRRLNRTILILIVTNKLAKFKSHVPLEVEKSWHGEQWGYTEDMSVQTVSCTITRAIVRYSRTVPCATHDAVVQSFVRSHGMVAQSVVQCDHAQKINNHMLLTHHSFLPTPIGHVQVCSCLPLDCASKHHFKFSSSSIQAHLLTSVRE